MPVQIQYPIGVPGIYIFVRFVSNTIVDKLAGGFIFRSPNVSVVRQGVHFSVRLRRTGPKIHIQWITHPVRVPLEAGKRLGPSWTSDPYDRDGTQIRGQKNICVTIWTPLTDMDVTDNNIKDHNKNTLTLDTLALDFRCKKYYAVKNFQCLLCC